MYIIHVYCMYIIHVHVHVHVHGHGHAFILYVYYMYIICILCICIGCQSRCIETSGFKSRHCSGMLIMRGCVLKCHIVFVFS